MDKRMAAARNINQMYKTKKGALPAQILVIIIIATIIVIIAASLYFGIVKALPAGGEGLDTMCRVNNGIIDKITLIHPDIRPFCKSRSVDIFADDWDKCDPNGNWSYEENKNYRDCAAEQVYHLISRCWYMYGEDKLTLKTDWYEESTCFKFKVHSPEPIYISDWVISTQIMEPHGYCRSGVTSEGIVKMHNDDCEDGKRSGGCDDCGSKNSITGQIETSENPSNYYSQEIEKGERWEILYIYQDDDQVVLEKL